MAANIQSSANPVLISAWSVTQKKTVEITWSTDSPFLGYVYRSIDGGPEEIFDGRPMGKISNSTTPIPTQVIELGKTYDFRLKRNSMLNPVLATLRLKGEEKLGTTKGLATVIKELAPRSQHIFGVRVEPGVDSVRFKFRTRQATGAAVQIANDATQKVVAFALSTGVNLVHDVVISKDVNFMLQSFDHDTIHSFRIIAPALPGSLTTKESVATGKYRTGGRSAQVFFERILVHDDGDPGLLGDGDFFFSFGAGDADTGEDLGNFENFGYVSIGSGKSKDVNRVVNIPRAPANLWAQVVAEEDDSLFSSFGSSSRGTSFAPPGNTCQHFESDYGEAVVGTVTQHFDFSALTDDAESRPFKMTNDSCPIHFTLEGQIRIEAHSGGVLQPFIKRLAPRSPMPHVAAVLRAGEQATVGTRPGLAHAIRLAPGGALFAMTCLRRPAEHSEQWTRIGDEVAGPVTVVASSENQIRLFALDQDGAVSHKTFSRDIPPNDAWEPLGGEFVGSIAAAVGPEGRIEIFGLSRDGVVSHRTLSTEGTGPAASDWQRIGDGVSGSLTAFTTPRGVSVIALDRDGEVLHKLMRGNEWRPAGREWQSLGRAPGGPLFAELVEDDVVVLAVLAEDETVHLRPWRNYPDAPPRDDWRSVGTINSLLDARLSLIEPSPEKDAVETSSGTHRKELLLK
jgi:hypothetical protein